MLLPADGDLHVLAAVIVVTTHGAHTAVLSGLRSGLHAEGCEPDTRDHDVLSLPIDTIQVGFISDELLYPYITGSYHD